MKTLISGEGPIGQWLALRLHKVGVHVTVAARGRTVAPELLDLADEFRLMATRAGALTPTLDGLPGSVRQGETRVDRKEVA